MNTQANKPSTTAIVKKEEFTYPATEKGTLYLSVELQRQIEWLHKQVGAKEWCGVLFYKRLEGDIDNPKDLKLRAEAIYLMDIGRETYTEADFDPDTAFDQWNVLKTNPDDANEDVDYGAWKRGLIHTHHNMTTFFSGTDMAELHDNAPTHNYYLSLIVNFSGVYTAKVAFVAKRRVIMEYTNVTDETRNLTTEKEILMMIDMNIIKDHEEVAVPTFFRSRYADLKTQIEERNAAKTASSSTTTNAYTGLGVGGSGDEDWENDDWTGQGGTTTPTRNTVQGSSSLNRKAVQGTLLPSGDLQKGDKILKPIGKVELAITNTILLWLKDAVKICSDMEPPTEFTSIQDALNYFRDYFDEPSHDLVQFNWFINQMQRDMTVKFTKWFPILVQRVGMETMDVPMLNNPIAASIYDLFSAYPQYLIELGRIGQKDEEQTSKKGSQKKRQQVNARRR